MEIEDISFDKIDILFTISVENPYPMGLTLAGYDYDLLIEESSFISGRSSEELRVSSGDTSTISLPLSFTFKELREVLRKTEGKREAPYTLNVGLDIDVPLASKDFRVEKSSEGSLPVPNLPEVSLKELIITNFGRTIISLEYGIKVNNPNTFEIDLGELEYSLSVDNNRWVSGTTGRSYTLEPEESKVVHMPLELNYLEVGRTVVDLLMSGQELAYRVDGSSSVGIHFENFEIPDYSFDIEKTGTAAIIRP